MQHIQYEITGEPNGYAAIRIQCDYQPVASIAHMETDEATQQAVCLIEAASALLCLSGEKQASMDCDDIVGTLAEGV